MHTDKNLEAVLNEMAWLVRRIDHSLTPGAVPELPLPVLDPDSHYAQVLNDFRLGDAERVAMNLALAQLLYPEVFLSLALHANDQRIRLIFGGAYRVNDPTFRPTLRTAIALLSGGDQEKQAYYSCWFHPKRPLFASGLVQLRAPYEDANLAEHSLCFNPQFTETVLYGHAPRLDGDAGFPAARSKRTHTLTDVILNEQTMHELAHLRRFAARMAGLWKLPDASKYRSNFVCIFSGEPGTGKSHTAEALGNELDLPVYKINLAQMVSKYIGETEKNLERVFDRFHEQRCILFFDEAEAIFSKRTEVTDAHDKYANQEQAYLLQKLEEFSGIIILATNVQNLKQYFDKAFQRRIRRMVHFSFPEYSERLRLWEHGLGESFEYEQDLPELLAKNYQLTGGSIYNIISDAVLMAMDRGTNQITQALIEESLAEEFRKTGRKYEMVTDDLAAKDPSRRYGMGMEQRRNF